jgi:uncharacterized caspase-like protein
MIPRLLYLCCLVGFPLLLSAAERAALVIGVNRYSAFPADKQLSSPVNDAQDVAQRLAAMGFVVRAPVLDGTRQAIMDAKRHFIDEARGAQVAVFYFSGHGFQVGDENYLIPSDMPAISSFTVLRENAVQLRDSVMAGLEEAGAGTKVVILDCCRDNPFAGQIAAALGTKSLRTKGGGGEISGYGPGFFLAFASSPGATALDGNGARNSPFTAALIRHLDEEPGANLRDLFDGVKSTISEVHGQEQVPWVNDSLNRQHVKVLAKLIPSNNTPAPPAMSETEIEKRARELAAKMAAEASQPAADTGGLFTNSLGMKFVSVPGTQVRMCIHETRNADYAAYAAAQSGVDDAWRDHAAGSKDQHPVVNVSHEDAEAFCRWLSAKEGKNYRLPTDAEWSAAVGLASETGRTPREKDESGQDAFPWGRHWPPRPSDGNYQISGVNDGHAGTAPVMSFPPNGLGLHDLGGNGMEWCQDWTDDSRVFRVQRGGSWRDDSRVSVRASTRSYGRPVERMDFQSFRIVFVSAGN